MKKLVFLFLASAFVFSGCSNDDDNATPVAAPAVLVKQTVETFSDLHTTTTNYTYDGNKIVKLVAHSTDNSPDYTLTYTYDGNYITRIQGFSEGVSTIKEDFAYNAAGKLTSYIETDLFPGEGYRENYTYNADGTVTILGYSGTATEQTTLAYTGKVFFANGEVSKIVEYDDSSLPVTTDTVTYTYDAHNSIFKNVTGYALLSFYGGDAFGINHNITKEVSTDTDGNVYDTINYSYTYGGNDFPATSTQPDILGDLSTIQYTY